MNFLGHLYLSGHDDEVMVGNILGDFLKNNDTSLFPEKIQKGIMLHHRIDFFTDNHPVVQKSKKRLRPIFSHYSPVVVDMYYDHFLSSRWSEYSNVDLYHYSHHCYKLLYENRHYFPTKARRLFLFMRLENIFVAYGSLSGINRVLNRMSDRTKFKSNLDLAAKELVQNYSLYEEEFRLFFSDMIDFAKIEREKLLL